MGEPGGLPSVGSHRVGHDWSDAAAAAAALSYRFIKRCSKCLTYKNTGRMDRMIFAKLFQNASHYKKALREHCLDLKPSQGTPGPKRLWHPSG